MNTDRIGETLARVRAEQSCARLFDCERRVVQARELGRSADAFSARVDRLARAHAEHERKLDELGKQLSAMRGRG